MPKRTLRQQFLARRRSMSDDVWRYASNLAQIALIALPEFQTARCIAVYAPFQHETDTVMIVETAFKLGKRVLYPAVCGENMMLRQVTALESLAEGTYGILEPCANGVEHTASEADLIVIPGVAFDLSGHRIGYGKGYYDRFLNSLALSATLIGFCHDFQVVETPLPSEEHDVRLNLIVTEKRIIRCRSNRVNNCDSNLYKGEN